jgi:hypothetical protein
MEITLELNKSGHFLVWPIEEYEDKNACRKEDLQKMLNQYSEEFKGVDGGITITLTKQPDSTWKASYDSSMPIPWYDRFQSLVNEHQTVLQDWQEQK